jgi:septal ring factor EnvC (AmiA/AmiB activator)
LDPLAPAANGLDLERLEAAVRDLADRFLAQRDEATKLRGEIEVRDRRVEELETEVRRLQQSRRDVARRIDELIDQIGQLEGRLATQARAEAP